ncbi:MAG: hypothetical protein DRH89_10155 [Candidatus Cloacimonadota bacterium]|nr:MAG: hypothetical protein DRH89_10155 [Candidatus Cloacimonadota bacterium]
MRCSQNNPEVIVKNADFNSETNTLQVDYMNNPDTSLLEIVALSNVHKSGYGLLLNIDNAYSNPELDTLKLKFRKLDINAVHSFDVVSVETLPANIIVAMEDTKFIWILDKKHLKFNEIPFGKAISAIQEKREDKMLIVISKN